MLTFAYGLIAAGAAQRPVRIVPQQTSSAALPAIVAQRTAASETAPHLYAAASPMSRSITADHCRSETA
jgi:hypothetical protein